MWSHFYVAWSLPVGIQYSYYYFPCMLMTLRIVNFKYFLQLGSRRVALFAEKGRSGEVKTDLDPDTRFNLTRSDNLIIFCSSSLCMLRSQSICISANRMHVSDLGQWFFSGLILFLYMISRPLNFQDYLTADWLCFCGHLTPYWPHQRPKLDNVTPQTPASLEPVTPRWPVIITNCMIADGILTTGWCVYYYF